MTIPAFAAPCRSATILLPIPISTKSVCVRACANNSNNNNNIKYSGTILPPVRGGRISHALILEQATAAVLACDTSNNKYTVDFPPERTEARSGTLVARYENNLNFAEKLLGNLAPGIAVRHVGGYVTIRDNVNPQGGGEYLDDDECITGLRAGRYIVLINAGVDHATLCQLDQVITPNSNNIIYILVNGGLDRLSWFDTKLGALRKSADTIQQFQPAYYCKVVAGQGVLLYTKYNNSNTWTAFLPRPDGHFRMVKEWKLRPKITDVEQAFRLAAQNNTKD